ncbi:unnamed protein product [Ixodes hexagonus]
MMSQDHLLKLDAVLSSEQMRALLQDAGGPHSHSDKLDFDVLGNVGGTEDGNHPLAAIEDLHDLDSLVLEQGSASGGLFTETTDADVEALLKATLGAEDLLSPMELVFLDHCYSMPLGAVPVGEGLELVEEADGLSAPRDVVPDCTSPSEDADSEEAHSFGASSPGSPQLPLRRSQRQIERIDRERLERIKAENAELKRKEQEEMGRGQGAGSVVAPLGPEEAGTPLPPLQSPPPVLASPPPVVPVVAATPPPVPAPVVVPVPVASPPHQPALARAPPVQPKEKPPKVVALPAHPSPAKRSKPRNSESFSSDGTAEDASVSSPSHGAEEATTPTPRPRKKRQRSHDLDDIMRDVAKLHEGSAVKKAVKKGVEAAKALSSKKEAKRAAIKEESRGEGAGLKRKAEEAEKEGKKKQPPQEVSPFGKVVKVVRTMPEVKKRPRRESFTDEPALFSQPDVLIKEHEPHSGPNPPPNTTPSPLPNPPITGDKDVHMEESSYDTVEAHVARLAGGDHSLPLASPTVPVVAATPVATAPAVAPAPAPALTPAAAHPPKPTTPVTPVTKPVTPLPKVPTPAAVQKKPTAPAQKPGQGPEKKRPLAIAIKSAPPPLPSQAKPKPAEHPAAPTHPPTPPAHPKPAKPVFKGAEGAVKGVGHPKKGADPQLKKVKVPRPEPPSPFPPVAERPKRQSKEKFKRAMMRKREMGRRVDDEDVDDSSEEQHGSDWSSEDDPEKLWCICRQPHNDKFMIQCDKCEDWFHGTCVGVTRQQGRLWEKENREWVCPKCSKALGVEGRTVAPIKKESQRPPDEKAQLPKAPPKVETPVKPALKGVLRECLVCKRRTECVGLYCGRDCIAKYVNDASQTIKAAKLDGERRLMFTERSSGKLVAGVQTPTPDKLTDWLVRNPTYELAVARTPSRPPSQKPPQPKTTPAKTPAPAKPAAKQPPPQAVAQSTVATAAVPSVAGGVPVGTAPAENMPAAVVPEVKKQAPPPPEIEPVRINVRKVLRDSLSNRCKDADDISLSGDEVKRMAVRIEEELFKYFKDTGTKYKSKYRSLVFNIKDTRNQASHVICSGALQGLFRKILKGKIAPDKLVRMTPEELASKELAKWRERENQHTLEMIKKEQMEAAQNVSSHALIKKTHKGEVEIDDDNLRLLEKTDEKPTAEQPEPVVTTTPRVSTGGSTGSAILDAAERPGRDTTDAHRSHLFDLNCKICTGKVAAPPLPTTSADEAPAAAAAASPQHQRRGSATPADAGDLSSSSSSSSSVSSSVHASPPPPPPPARDGASSSRSDTPPPPPPPLSSHADKKSKKVASRRSRDDSSDLEPSSTVSLGSPDSGVSGSRGSQGGKGPSSVWKGFISMQEVSKFVTSAYKVSGPTDFLSQDIPDTINVCGRIIPDQVWDYISKIKQSGNKELLVIRFQPANEEEKKPYRELYSYLNSRKRCGVVGGLSRMLKDFYILPLPSHSPVPTVLMPFEGPGLMSGRPHMLLGVIVRHKNRPRGAGKGSRASWAERSSLDSASFTPPPPETTPSGGNSDDEEPYEPSYTPPLEKRRSRRKAELHPEDDDDVPYDPEDNDVGFGSGGGAPEAPPLGGGATEAPPRVGGASATLVSGQTVSELIERISAGANPAEVTTSVLASIATNSDLEHQKRLLLELTQEVEEQKRLIELQRLQAITMVMNKSATSGPSATAKGSDASGIPFLDSSLPTDTGLSFLSSGAPAPAASAASAASCSLPSTLQELLNKVKAPPAPPPMVAPPPGPAPNVGALLASVAAVPSPPQQPSVKKPIAEDPIVKHFAGDATPESDSEAMAAGETPPPPGESIDDTVVAALAATPAVAPPGVTQSPGTPTKDEMTVEEARPQDPRRRKAAAAAPAPTPAVVVAAAPPVAPAPSAPAVGTGGASSSTGSKLGAKSASELMEMARKQLEEMEGVPMSGPPMSVAPPAPAPMFVQPPPSVPVAPPPMMGAPPPPPGMYGPPPPMDGGFVPPPPQGMGFPPPDPQWGPGYWKGPPPSVPPPPPPTGWNGGGRGDFRQRGGDWRSGGGRRSQWDQRR